MVESIWEERSSMPRKAICAICETARLLGGKWDIMVIRYLLEGPKRFTELREMIPDISSKSLSATLKQLDAKGIVVRTVTAGFPISVAYSLTKKGQEMKGMIEAMRRWGEKWVTAK
jgi:DNA-binding HxlR family transcriptional regulator